MRRSWVDVVRPLRRWAGRIEAAQVGWLGASALSVAYRQPVLVLETTGRRSGRPRRTVVAYREVDGQLLVVGGAGGQARRPDWVANLLADPRVVVTLRRRTREMTAEVVDGSHRQALWDRLLPVLPMIAKYEQRAGHPIPVIVLRPRT